MLARQKHSYYNGDDLVHRIVFFGEADSLPIGGSAAAGSSLADGDSHSSAASALRNLVSEGELSYDVVERDIETGQFTTRHVRKPGPTLLITTTTRAIRGQMGTRLWEMALKEDDEQLTAALSMRAEFELTRKRANPFDLKRYQQYLQERAPWDVIVPFARELATGMF
jgi:hypothetical protein